MSPAPTTTARMKRALRALRANGRRVSASTHVEHRTGCPAHHEGNCTCEPKIMLYVTEGARVTIYRVDAAGGVHAQSTL